MGSTRLIVMVLMVAAGALGRARAGAALEELRLRLLWTGPDDLYRLAERQYAAGDFEKAKLSCENALKLSPSHAPGVALLAELRFVLARRSPYDDPAPGFTCTPVRHEQTILEIDRCLASADELLGRGERDKATAEYRKIFEYAKWIPASKELARRCDRARLGLAGPPPPKPASTPPTPGITGSPVSSDLPSSPGGGGGGNPDLGPGTWDQKENGSDLAVGAVSVRIDCLTP